MTTKVAQVGDWLLKILVPLFVALSSFALNSVQTEIKELRQEIRDFHAIYQARIERLSTDMAVMQIRLDHSEGKR